VTRPASGALWSLFDQSTLSGTNFLVSLYFARELPPSAYGTFAAAFALFLFAAGMHNAVLTEPMCVLAPDGLLLPRRAYLSQVLTGHLWWAAATAALLGPAALLLAHLRPELSQALGLAAWSAPVLLFHWLLRRACYVWTEPRDAFLGSLSYALLAFVFSLLAGRLGLNGASAPMLVLTLSSLGCSAGLLIRLGVRSWPSLRLQAGLLRAHWRYGRWNLGSAAVFWLADSAFPVLLIAWAGPAVSARFRAGENFFLPLAQLAAALTLFYLPRLARQRAQAPSAALRLFARQAALWTSAGALFYLGVILAVQAPLAHFVYARPEYSSIGSILLPLGLAAVLRAVSDIALATPIRSTGDSRSVFFACSAAAAATLLLLGPLLLLLGWPGAAYARLASVACQSLVLAYRFHLTPRRASPCQSLTPSPDSPYASPC